LRECLNNTYQVLVDSDVNEQTLDWCPCRS
jgi:hypothetical protein